MNIKPLLLALIASVCLCCMPMQHPSVQQLRNVSVALIVDIPEVGVRPYCSGVMVGKREILTAYHCVQAISERMEVAPDDVAIHYILSQDEPKDMVGEPSASHLAKVKRYDVDHDIALLTTFEDHQFVQVASQRPEILERLTFMTNPHGMYFSAGVGWLASVREKIGNVDSDGPWLQIDEVGVFHGSSGGGAFNARGELVGLVDFGQSVPQVLFCVDTTTINKFVREK